MRFFKASTPFIQKISFSIAISFILIMAIVAIFAPFIAPYPPDMGHTELLAAPSLKFLCGTDGLGQDVLSRLIYGARVSLCVGLVSVGISISIGLCLGLVAGYFRGWVDECIMRFVDIMLCFPSFFLILAVVAILDASLINIMVVIGVTSWMGVARLVRAEALSLRERDFVAAARLSGAGHIRIIFKHVLPNAIGPVLVSATLGVAGAILIESSLSFLGIGVEVPKPSWGNMLMEAKETLGVAWWLSFFPGFVILLTVLSYNILGEFLRDKISSSR